MATSEAIYLPATYLWLWVWPIQIDGWSRALCGESEIAKQNARKGKTISSIYSKEPFN